MTTNIDIFEDTEQDIRDLIDPDAEDIISIDLESLDASSRSEATDMIDNLSRLYSDEEFLKRQPAFKRRVEEEIESLRINIKMRKADEQAHDILLKNISQNSSNASLYRALTELQKTIVGITSKIDDTITRLTNLIKSYQTEINFEEPAEDDTEETPQYHTTFKGSKSFIESMSDDSDAY